MLFEKLFSSFRFVFPHWLVVILSQIATTPTPHNFLCTRLCQCIYWVSRSFPDYLEQLTNKRKILRDWVLILVIRGNLENCREPRKTFTQSCAETYEVFFCTSPHGIWLSITKVMNDFPYLWCLVSGSWSPWTQSGRPRDWPPWSLRLCFIEVRDFGNLQLPQFNPFCIRITPRRVLLQTVKTQTKCSIMLHFIRVYTVCKSKNYLQQNKPLIFKL